MKIKIESKSGILPEYKTEGASGMDLRAYLSQPVVIAPGKRALIPTGIAIELPEGYEAQIRARSGLAVKYGIGLVNGIGTIDSDYRGEIKIPLINYGEELFTVQNGERIAQIVIAKYEKICWETVEFLGETKRGDGGFGHSGRK